MRIGELAERAAVPAKTIRYYESIGILPEPERTPSGYRDYAPDAVRRLRFVRAAQTAGLRLREIRSVLAVRDGGEAPCAHVTDLLADQLTEVARRIEELVATRGELETLLARAQRLDPADCGGDEICHILVRDPT